MLQVNGQVLIPEGSAKHSWVTREDCARAAAGALAGKLTDIGPIDVTGPEALSFINMMPCYVSISGQSVDAKVLPEQEILAQVLAKGVPQAAAGFVVGVVTARDMATTPTDTVMRASGTQPTSVDEVLRSLVLGQQFKKSERKQEDQIKKSRKAINEKVRLYARVGKALITAKAET